MNILTLIGGILGSIPSLIGYVLKTEELNSDLKKRNAAWMFVCLCLVLGSCYLSTRNDTSAIAFADCVRTICSVDFIREVINNERLN